MDPVMRVAYTLEEAAQALGISRTRAFAAVREGALRSYKDGRRRMVSTSAVSDYVRQKERAAEITSAK